MYNYTFAKDWDKFFNKLPSDISLRVVKKLNSLLTDPYKRHLKGKSNYFVAEVGQYRITYRIFEDLNEIRFYFVGKHKEYEKWYKS